MTETAKRRVHAVAKALGVHPGHALDLLIRRTFEHDLAVDEATEVREDDRRAREAWEVNE